MSEKMLKQAQLAMALDVSQSTVSRWLAGSPPRKVIAAAIARHVDVSLEWLLEGVGPQSFFSIYNRRIGSKLYDGSRRRSKKETSDVIWSELERAPTEFGIRVGLLRRAIGLTLAEFAKRCGYGRSYLSRIESASRTSPSSQFVSKLAEEFGVSQNWLLFGHPPLLEGAGRLSDSERHALEAVAIRELEKSNEETRQWLRAFWLGKPLSDLTKFIEALPEKDYGMRQLAVELLEAGLLGGGQGKSGNK